MDERFERMKSALFNWGLDYIEEVLGYEVDGWDKDALDSVLDEAYAQMPEEILTEFYQKFNID